RGTRAGSRRSSWPRAGSRQPTRAGRTRRTGRPPPSERAQLDRKGDRMAYRVIQWATGTVGVHAVPAIAAHPDLELTGLWVHSDAKVGRDAGEICGVGPLGVTATNDVDALLASDADCICYMAHSDVRPNEVIEDLARML